MATHSSIIAWRTPWTEEPGGLQSMGWGRKKSDTTEGPTLTTPSLNPFILYILHKLTLSLFKKIQKLLSLVTFL